MSGSFSAEGLWQILCGTQRGDNLEHACLGQLSRLASLDSHLEKALNLFPSKTSVASLSVLSASVLQIPLDLGREDLTQNPILCTIPQRSQFLLLLLKIRPKAETINISKSCSQPPASPLTWRDLFGLEHVQHIVKL